jgi:hypothetical protein
MYRNQVMEQMLASRRVGNGALRAVAHPEDKSHAGTNNYALRKA